MHQISSKVGRPSRQIPKIDRLEAEYQQNQERIRQLHRRNRDLAEQMRTVQQENNSLPVRSIAQRSPMKSRRPKSLARLIVDRIEHFNRIRVGRYSLVFWLKAAVMMLIVAMVCGTLGFMATRLVGLLIGG
jgi:cell division septum initiation protein DivIVA